MISLHIEHPITDFQTWADAFATFADERRNAGVQAHRVRRPINDPKYIFVELDFETVEAATAFRAFLESVVWAVPGNAPALAGTPRTELLNVEVV